MTGALLGPQPPKPTALYLRSYQLKRSNPDKISQVFSISLWFAFVTASAYGFERQAVRRACRSMRYAPAKMSEWPVFKRRRRNSWPLPAHHYWVWFLPATKTWLLPPS